MHPYLHQNSHAELVIVASSIVEVGLGKEDTLSTCLQRSKDLRKDSTAVDMSLTSIDLYPY